MSGGNVLKFLVSEEVFESYGTEVQIKETMETRKTDTEMVAYVGQLLLMKFMNQNEEIQSLRSVLSEQDQEMKYVKKKQKYLKAVDASYKVTLREMEIENEELEKVNYACQQELRRLQQKLSRLKETDALLRKSIFELAESRSVRAIQPETLANLPTRNHCLLCLNPKDHSDIHNKLNDDLLRRLWATQKRCANLELGVEAENRKKKILDEKLIALRKEVDALTLYLKWSGTAGLNDTSCGSGEIIVMPYTKTPECEKQELEDSVANFDDSDERTERKMDKCQTGETDRESNSGQLYQISERTILQIRDGVSSHLMKEAVKRTRNKCWMGKSEEQLKFNECIEMSEMAQSDNSDDVSILNMRDEPGNHPKNVTEIQKMKSEVNPGYKGKMQEPETSKSANNRQDYEELDAHCSLCVIDGRCQACKAMQEKSIGCFGELFQIIIDIIRAILRDQ